MKAKNWLIIAMVFCILLIALGGLFKILHWEIGDLDGDHVLNAGIGSLIIIVLFALVVKYPSKNVKIFGIRSDILFGKKDDKDNSL